MNQYPIYPGLLWLRCLLSFSRAASAQCGPHHLARKHRHTSIHSQLATAGLQRSSFRAHSSVPVGSVEAARPQGLRRVGLGLGALRGVKTSSPVAQQQAPQPLLGRPARAHQQFVQQLGTCMMHALWPNHSNNDCRAFTQQPGLRWRLVEVGAPTGACMAAPQSSRMPTYGLAIARARTFKLVSNALRQRRRGRRRGVEAGGAPLAGVAGVGRAAAGFAAWEGGRGASRGRGRARAGRGGGGRQRAVRRQEVCMCGPKPLWLRKPVCLGGANF
jgi:hypothetical protein